VVSVVVFFIFIFAAMGFAVYKTTQLQTLIDFQKAELESIQEKIDQLEASSDYLSPEDIFTLATVARGRLTWSRKLSILGNILPKDVAITELTYDETMNAFVIKGISKIKTEMKDLDLVVSIIDIIKAEENFSSDFSEIKFQSSQRVKRGEQEIVKFEIACLLKS
jgi:hypothetical protein